MSDAQQIISVPRLAGSVWPTAAVSADVLLLVLVLLDGVLLLYQPLDFTRPPSRALISDLYTFEDLPGFLAFVAVWCVTALCCAIGARIVLVVLCRRRLRQLSGRKRPISIVGDVLLLGRAGALPTLVRRIVGRLHRTRAGAIVVGDGLDPGDAPTLRASVQLATDAGPSHEEESVLAWSPFLSPFLLIFSAFMLQRFLTREFGLFLGMWLVLAVLLGHLLLERGPIQVLQHRVRLHPAKGVFVARRLYRPGRDLVLVPVARIWFPVVHCYARSGAFDMLVMRRRGAARVLAFFRTSEGRTDRSGAS